MKARPVERIAGLAFFAFTVLQVPFMLVESDLAAWGLVQLAPLQVAAASLAKQFPALHPYLLDVLTPGTWVREALSPAIRCAVSTGGRGPCEQQRARLGDLAWVRNGTNLPLLVQLLETGGLGGGQLPIVYGCMLITVSALFSLYYSVKTAVVGFLLLAVGIVQGDHTPLPPAILMAFLCLYAGFQLGDMRGNMRAAAAGGSSSGAAAAAAAGRPAAAAGQQQQKGATVQRLTSGKGGTPGKRKQRKA